MNCAICHHEIRRAQGADGEAVWVHAQDRADHDDHDAQPVREVML